MFFFQKPEVIYYYFNLCLLEDSDSGDLVTSLYNIRVFHVQSWIYQINWIVSATKIDPIKVTLPLPNKKPMSAKTQIQKIPSIDFA